MTARFIFRFKRSPGLQAFPRRILVYLVFFLGLNAPAKAQYGIVYDEIPVLLKVKQLGETEMPALVNEQALYLSVTDLFGFLRVEHRISPAADSVWGFLLHPLDPYRIVLHHHSIEYRNTVYDVDPDAMIIESGRIYLRTDVYGRVFGLDCTFNIRTLAVLVTPKTELPVIRALRLERQRMNLTRSWEIPAADTVIGRKNRFFHIGAFDWSVNAMQEIDGLRFARYSAGVGGSLAGGELKAVLTHTTLQPFSEKLQYYLWRYVNNNNRYLRQVSAGRIAPQLISSVFDPVIGVQFTNAPTWYRRSFGTYRLNGYFRPDWQVELYVNNTLIDYVRSDASGFLSYDVPMSYGATEIKTRYVGPWGDEHSFTRHFNIPVNFLPARELEYRVSAGVVEDQPGSRFGQGRLNYGLTDQITVGGGLEYFSSLERGNNMPFLNTSIRLAPHLFVAGEYVHDTRYKGSLTYQLSAMQAELYYTRYNSQQEAVRLNYGEERRASVTVPFRRRNFSALSRLSVRQNSLGARKYNNVEFTLSAATRLVQVSLNSFAIYNSNSDPYVYSNLFAAVRLPGRFSILPRATFDHSRQGFVSATLGLEKYFFRNLAVNASVERGYLQQQYYFRAGFRYDFSFARVSASVVHSRESTVFFQNASGSLIYGRDPAYIDVKQQSQVGRGGFVFSPFLDLDANGRRDAGEPAVSGLDVRVYGGGTKKTRRDTSVVVTGLEAYNEYTVKLETGGLESIGWKVDKKVLRIVVDPSQLKQIDVPVSVYGEVSGSVRVLSGGRQQGPGRLKVNIYDEQSRLVAGLVTESDGYFSYLGLKPGNYTARIDRAQLERQGLETATDAVPFTIGRSVHGDVVDTLEFVVEKRR